MVLTGKIFNYLNQAILENKLYKIIPTIDILGYCYLNLGGVIVNYTALEQAVYKWFVVYRYRATRL